MADALDKDTLALLDESIEVDIRTPRRNGSMSSRPIWVVVVDGEAYVRSYRGEQGAWFRRVRADGNAVLEAEGRTIEVGAEMDADDERLNRAIDSAFRAKYGERSPRPTEAMVSPEVKATTMRLTA